MQTCKINTNVFVGLGSNELRYLSMVMEYSNSMWGTVRPTLLPAVYAELRHLSNLLLNRYIGVRMETPTPPILDPSIGSIIVPYRSINQTTTIVGLTDGLILAVGRGLSISTLAHRFEQKWRGVVPTSFTSVFVDFWNEVFDGYAARPSRPGESPFADIIFSSMSRSPDAFTRLGTPPTPINMTLFNSKIEELITKLSTVSRLSPAKIERIIAYEKR